MTVLETPFDEAGALHLFLYAAQLGLGGLFLASAVPKLRAPRAFAETVVAYRILPPRWSRAFAPIVIGLEVGLALAFLSGGLVVLALAVAAGLILSFVVAIVTTLATGRDVSCGCFGQTSEPVTWRSLARVMVVLAVVAGMSAVLALSAQEPTSLADLSAAGAASLRYVVDAGAVAVAVAIALAWMLHASDLGALARTVAGSRRGEEA